MRARLKTPCHACKVNIEEGQEIHPYVRRALGGCIWCAQRHTAATTNAPFTDQFASTGGNAGIACTRTNATTITRLTRSLHPQLPNLSGSQGRS
ncbi:hypothetical protein WJX84_008349 [Apatococcus fuscideae]|uniref:Uncharacterized protein n=1 Tax=Apatococcus fuscideae TaxID=2026836 RepID=A0AAW1SMJ6_9CHLO